MNFTANLMCLFIALFFISCGNEPASTTTQKPTAQNTSGTYKPTIQTDLNIVLAPTSGTTGETVCMDVSIKDFNKIVSIQHSVNWDAKVLKFNKVGGFNLKGMTVGSFGLTKVEEGNFAVSWYDPAVKGFSLADNTKIYEICFDIIGVSGTSSPVRISGVPVSVEVSTVDERILGIPTGKGKITVK